MKIVIDTNIMFSTLIVKNPKHEEILFGNLHTFFTPNFAFLELYEKKEPLMFQNRTLIRPFERVYTDKKIHSV